MAISARQKKKRTAASSVYLTSQQLNADAIGQELMSSMSQVLMTSQIMVSCMCVVCAALVKMMRKKKPACMDSVQYVNASAGLIWVSIHIRRQGVLGEFSTLDNFVIELRDKNF